jgi:hypothetical protein
MVMSLNGASCSIPRWVGALIVAMSIEGAIAQTQPVESYLTCVQAAYDESTTAALRCNASVPAPIVAPERQPVWMIKQCAQTTAGKHVQFGVLGQRNPSAVRRLYVVSAGQQGLSGENDRRNALTGQPDNYATVICGGAQPLSGNGVVAAIVSDPDLYNPNDSAILVVMANGGQAQTGAGAINHAMVEYWSTQVRALATPATLDQLYLSGMSLGGAMIIALARELDDHFASSQLTIGALDPTGQPGAGNWFYPVSREKTANPISRWSNDFIWTIDEPAAWSSRNTYGEVWTSGDPIVFRNPAWGRSGAFGKIHWHNFNHQDVGMNWKEHLHLQIPSFFRTRQRDLTTGVSLRLAEYAGLSDSHERAKTACVNDARWMLAATIETCGCPVTRWEGVGYARCVAWNPTQSDWTSVSDRCCVGKNESGTSADSPREPTQRPRHER